MGGKPKKKTKSQKSAKTARLPEKTVGEADDMFGVRRQKSNTSA